MTASIEQVPASSDAFQPTPEKLASLSFLDLKQEEVHELLRSANGRKDLLRRIVENASDIRKIHPDFDPEVLPLQLKEVSELLEEKEKFLASSESSEKQSLFQRALKTIREFPKKHPFITGALGIALITAGLVRLGYLKWPTGGLFGLGEGGAASEGLADAAGAAAKTEVGAVAGEGIAVELPEVVRQAVKAAEAFNVTPNDFVVVGRQILFRGKLYDANLSGVGVEPDEVMKILKNSGLADALTESGIVGADRVRVFYDASARYTTWSGLHRLLHGVGVDPVKVHLWDQVLEQAK